MKNAHTPWSLPDFAIARPITVAMLVITLLALGLICWQRTPLEFIMRVDMPFLSVYIPYPGAAPEQVQNEVAIPAEGEFMTLPGLRRVTTTSDSGGCSVFLQFDWGVPMSVAAAELRDRIERLKLQLPGDVDRVFIRRFSSDEFPVLRFALFRDENQDELAHLARTRLRNRLMRVEGVADIQVSGRERDEVYVELDQDALHSLHLPLYGVVGSLQGSAVNMGVGRLDDGMSRYYVRAQDELTSPSSLANQIIGPNAVRLKDVAVVRTRGPEGAGSFTFDGKRGVFINVVKEAEANTVAVCDGIMEELALLQSDPDYAGVEFFVFEDQAEIIRYSLGALFKAGLFGSALAFLVLFAFLRRLRATMFVAFMTPASLVLAFIFVYFTGRSLNMITIAAMLTATGMLVDNAIVVMENIHRHHALNPGNWRINARRGALEVALAITAATLTTIVVFIPVIYMDAGELSTFTKEFAGPVTVALLGSLMLALTVLPLAESRWRHRERPRRQTRPKPPLLRTFARLRIFSRVREAYLWFLRRVLHRRALVMAALAIGAAATFQVPFQQTGMQPVPSLDMRQINIRIHTDPNFGNEETRRMVADLEAIISKHRETLGITNLYVNSGGWGGVIQVYLVKQDDLPRGAVPPYTTEEARLILTEIFHDNLPGARIETGIARATPDAGREIQVRMRGDDTETLYALVEELRRQMAALPGLSQVRTDRDRATPELQVHIDPERAAMAGVAPMQVARTVDFALRGTRLPVIKQGGSEIPVWAQFRREDRENPEDLKNVGIQSEDGTLVPLKQMAELARGAAPSRIFRENGKTLTTISAIAETDDYTAIRARLDALLENYEMPRGYNIDLGDSMRTLDENLYNFRNALILAIILIYLVMAALFESPLLPLSILTCVPLAFFGVYWSLYLTGTPLDTVALVGSILMCGIIVNNGIVIIDHINQMRRIHGLSRTDAIVAAGGNRIRPVLMTTMTTVLGCLPMAIGGEGGAGALASLGRALVGGLTAGTILTLFIVPIVYTYLDDLQIWVRRFFGGLAQLGTQDAPAAPPNR